MKRLINNLPTRTKLILSFSALLVLLAAVIATTYINLTDMAQSEKDLRDLHVESAIQFTALRSDVNHNRADLLELLIMTDTSLMATIEQGILDRDAKMDANIELLFALNPELTIQSQLQELKNELAVYRQNREQEIALIYAGKVAEARSLGSNEGARSYQKMRSLTYDMATAEVSNMDIVLASDQQSARSAIMVSMIIGLSALFLAVGLVIILNQTITVPLIDISRIAKRIGGGDLTVSLSTEERKDEIGTLNLAFRQMAETLRRSTSDLAAAVGLLGSSASEILAATTQVAAGTAEAAIAINQTTTTVEEVRQAAQLSSQKAQYVSDNAQRVAQVSQNGQKAVAETSAGMDLIRTQMETIAQTVVRLSEQSQSIGGIIASVMDLADQSNLLAVNAAIEAAKAGEHGRGFGVVAQEIKSLAEQSKQATSQVRGILSDVQKATSNAVMATEQGSKAVDAGVRQATQAGEAIRMLSESSDEAVQAATQIVASSQQQVVGMNQIGVAMENINQAGAQNAVSMKQMEASAQGLHQLGQQLKELVAQFKV